MPHTGGIGIHAPLEVMLTAKRGDTAIHRHAIKRSIGIRITVRWTQPDFDEPVGAGGDVGGDRVGAGGIRAGTDGVGWPGQIGIAIGLGIRIEAMLAHPIGRVETVVRHLFPVLFHRMGKDIADITRRNCRAAVLGMAHMHEELVVRNRLNRVSGLRQQGTERQQTEPSQQPLLPETSVRQRSHSHRTCSACTVALAIYMCAHNRIPYSFMHEMSPCSIPKKSLLRVSIPTPLPAWHSAAPARASAAESDPARPADAARYPRLASAPPSTARSRCSDQSVR